MSSCATVRGREPKSCTILTASWRGGSGGGTLLAVHSVATAACLLALTACAGPAAGRCHQGESRSLAVRLVPRGASATPAEVRGGGSLTLEVLLPDGRPAQAVRVDPPGPLATDGTGPSSLELRRSGTTTVTASDGRGGQYRRVVVVHC